MTPLSDNWTVFENQNRTSIQAELNSMEKNKDVHSLTACGPNDNLMHGSTYYGVAQACWPDYPDQDSYTLISSTNLGYKGFIQHRNVCVFMYMDFF